MENVVLIYWVMRREERIWAFLHWFVYDVDILGGHKLICLTDLLCAKYNNINVSCSNCAHVNGEMHAKRLQMRNKEKRHVILRQRERRCARVRNRRSPVAGLALNISLAIAVPIFSWTHSFTAPVITPAQPVWTHMHKHRYKQMNEPPLMCL